MHKKIFILFFTFICGISFLYSQSAYEQLDHYYYGVWETKKNAKIQIKASIRPRNQTSLFINGKEISGKSYYFARSDHGRGVVNFTWSSSDEQYVYELYFIAGGKYGNEYAVGFYSISRGNEEGEVLSEIWHTIKLYKTKDYGSYD